MLPVFRALATLRGLRGTPFNVFGYTAERCRERALIADYETMIEELLTNLAPGNHDAAVELASIPKHIRGFGHIKERHLAEAKAREGELLSAFRSPLSDQKNAAG